MGSPTSPALAEKVQAILASKRLTLYQSIPAIGSAVRPLFPILPPAQSLLRSPCADHSDPVFIRSRALSRISGYRVADWLRVFGYNLEDITRLQVLLPSKRTVVLDTSLTDLNEWMPWLDNRPDGVSMPSIVPLAKLVKAAPAQRIRFLKDPLAPRFLYAKVGTEDALAFPDLLPGSIVRVNRDHAGQYTARRTRRFLIVSFWLSTVKVSVVAVYASSGTVSSCPSTMGSVMHRLNYIVLKRQSFGALSISSSDHCCARRNRKSQRTWRAAGDLSFFPPTKTSGNCSKEYVKAGTFPFAKPLE